MLTNVQDTARHHASKTPTLLSTTLPSPRGISEGLHWSPSKNQQNCWNYQSPEPTPSLNNFSYNLLFVCFFTLLLPNFAFTCLLSESWCEASRFCISLGAQWEYDLFSVCLGLRWCSMLGTLCPACFGCVSGPGLRCNDFKEVCRIILLNYYGLGVFAAYGPLKLQMICVSQDR